MFLSKAAKGADYFKWLMRTPSAAKTAGAEMGVHAFN
jgi:hypothetical protein